MELTLFGLTELHNLSQTEIERLVVCIFKFRHLSFLEFEALVRIGTVIRLGSLRSPVLATESLRVIRVVFCLDRSILRLSYWSLNIVIEVVIESLVTGFSNCWSQGSIRPRLFSSRTHLCRV